MEQDGIVATSPKNEARMNDDVISIQSSQKKKKSIGNKITSVFKKLIPTTMNKQKIINNKKHFDTIQENATDQNTGFTSETLKVLDQSKGIHIKRGTKTVGIESYVTGNPEKKYQRTEGEYASRALQKLNAIMSVEDQLELMKDLNIKEPKPGNKLLFPRRKEDLELYDRNNTDDIRWNAQLEHELYLYNY